MSYELKDGQGSLFINDKSGNESRPDRRGEINIGGTLYRLSGWIKQGKNGRPWLSLVAETSKPKQASPVLASESDEDIPF